MKNLIMAICAFGGGFLAAGGEIALLVGLGIITRLIAITHTTKRNRHYESMIFLGAISGNCLSVYQFSLPVGRTGLLIYGIFSGIYTGCLIMALAELIHIFPIFARRIKITTGIAALIWSLALGKMTGSLLQFYMNW